MEKYVSHIYNGYEIFNNNNKNNNNNNNNNKMITKKARVHAKRVQFQQNKQTNTC